MSKPLGIGVITYNRIDHAIDCVQRIIMHTKHPYTLVVADDGSTDETVSYLREQDVKVITGKNHGVCWNKNRALYSLMEYHDCDPIILIEDDCWPNKDEWERDWIRAAEQWHHIGYALSNWPAGWNKGGRGTAEDPWQTSEMTGQATITTREAISRVGYLNTRFKGFGFGHIEWTERFCRLGYMSRNSIYCINSGFELVPSKTFGTREQIERNRRIIALLRKQPFQYVHPWASDEEKRELEQEIRSSLYLPY